MQLSRVTGETMSDFVSINETFFYGLVLMLQHNREP